LDTAPKAEMTGQKWKSEILLNYKAKK
jgi:hypothetical protein